MRKTVCGFFRAVCAGALLAPAYAGAADYTTGQVVPVKSMTIRCELESDYPGLRACLVYISAYPDGLSLGQKVTCYGELEYSMPTTGFSFTNKSRQGFLQSGVVTDQTDADGDLSVDLVPHHFMVSAKVGTKSVVWAECRVLVEG